MLMKYGMLLAVCAALLLIGCGSDKSATDTKGPDTQQEVQQEITPDPMQKDETDNKNTGVENAMPEENLDNGTPQEEIKQDDAGEECMDPDAMKKDDNSTKDDMDKTMPEKNSTEEQKSSEQDELVKGVLNT